MLVDFRESILDEDEVMESGAASPTGRRGLGVVKQRCLDFLFRPPSATAGNIDRLLRMLREDSPAESARVLIVGGGLIGAGGTAKLYSAPGLSIAAFDLYASPHTQLIADAHRIPFSDATFDAVVVQAVLEHVLDPWRVVLEIHRVLRPRGLVYAETPFLQQVHEGPYDFMRFTESGHRYLFRQFEIVDSGALLGAGAQLQWSIDHSVRVLSGSRRAGTLAKAALYWVRYLDEVARPGFDVDAASAVYFLGRRSDGAVSAREMVEHYKGAQRKVPGGLVRRGVGLSASAASGSVPSHRPAASIEARAVDWARRAARRRARRALGRVSRIVDPLRSPARAVFVVGCQRSGTTMLARALDECGSTDVFHERDPEAFRYVRIRERHVTQALLARSRASVVVFKPICDSQNVLRLLLDHNDSRALWIFRHHAAVADSCVRLWGDHILHAMRTVLVDRRQATWYAEHLSEERIQQLRGLCREGLTPHEGAALFWLLRNSLFFDLRLDRDPRVLLVAYEALVQSPESGFRRILGHVGLEWDPRVLREADPRYLDKKPRTWALDPAIEGACQELELRLCRVRS